MKFIYLIPTPNLHAFDKHINLLTSKTKDYLNERGHTLDTFLLDETYNNLGWCEELIFSLYNKNLFTDYDYLIFSHSDILIEKFMFLDFLNQYSFGRPFYFVSSVKDIKKLCEVNVKYKHASGKVKNLQSIFHGEKVGQKFIDIYFDDYKFTRCQDVDHSDHIFFLNSLNKLYPPLINPCGYDKTIDKLYHFTGVGVGSEMLYSRKNPDETEFFYWKFSGLMNYMCHNFRSAEYNSEELSYCEHLIKFALNKKYISKRSFKHLIYTIHNTNQSNLQVGIKKNQYIINKFLCI